MQEKIFELTVQEPLVVGTPDWVDQVAVNSGWVPIAAGLTTAQYPYKPTDNTVPAWQRGKRIWDVRPEADGLDKPTVIGSTGYQNISSITRGWCGGTVDPTRKELLLVANGGHTSYVGNEGYGLDLRDDIPSWRRLSDPTPNLQIDITAVPGTWTSTTPAATFKDGRGRTNHTAGTVQFAGGRVWWTLQSSTSTGAGQGAPGVFSWDRDWVASQPGGYAVHNQLDQKPFRLHGVCGATGDSKSYVFSCSAYDSVSDTIFGFGKASIWRISGASTANPVIIPPVSTGIQMNGFNGGWAVCLPDRRKILIGPSRDSHIVYVMDLTVLDNGGNIGPGIIQTVPLVDSVQWDPDSYWLNYANPTVNNDGRNNAAYGTTPYMLNSFSYGLGATYTGGKVYIGPTPTRPSGTLGGQVYELNPDTYRLTAMVNNGVRPVDNSTAPNNTSFTPGGHWGHFGRFNKVEFDGNKRFLTLAAAAVGPTYVWRLPDYVPSNIAYTPGHYAAYEVTRNGVDATFSNANHPGIVGVQLRYYWKDLEPTLGAYNFTQILTDLNNAQAVGKKVIVMLVDKTFNAQIATPSYLSTYTTGDATGTTLHRWKDYPRDRLIALIQAMASPANGINGHPALEAIATQETSVSMTTAQLYATQYTKEAYRDAYKAVLSAACVAFPTHRMFWYMNFIASTPTSPTAAGSGGQAMIGEVIDYMLAQGHMNFSFGGPDILPNNSSLVSLAYPYYNTYNGRVRMFCSNQFDSYESVQTQSPLVYHTMDYMLDYGATNLHINYCLWNYQQPANPAGSNDWADAVTAIAARPTFGPA